MGICRSVLSNQGLHCLLTESLDTTECMNIEQRLGRHFAHVPDGMNLPILGMCGARTFLLDTAYIISENSDKPIYSLDTAFTVHNLHSSNFKYYGNYFM